MVNVVPEKNKGRREGCCPRKGESSDFRTGSAFGKTYQDRGKRTQEDSLLSRNQRRRLKKNWGEKVTPGNGLGVSGRPPGRKNQETILLRWRGSMEKMLRKREEQARGREITA